MRVPGCGVEPSIVNFVYNACSAMLGLGRASLAAVAAEQRRKVFVQLQATDRRIMANRVPCLRVAGLKVNETARKT